jgi:hypothetical protein
VLGLVSYSACALSRCARQRIGRRTRPPPNRALHPRNSPLDRSSQAAVFDRTDVSLGRIGASSVGLHTRIPGLTLLRSYSMARSAERSDMTEVSVIVSGTPHHWARLFALVDHFS